jgi:hypothetical protein
VQPLVAFGHFRGWDFGLTMQMIKDCEIKQQLNRGTGMVGSLEQFSATIRTRKYCAETLSA